MAFIHHKQKIVGEIVDKAERTFALLATVEIARIVLNAAAIAQLLNHLKVIVDTFFQTFGLQGFVDGIEVVALGEHVVLNLVEGIGHIFLGGEKVAGRVDGDVLKSF